MPPNRVLRQFRVRVDSVTEAPEVRYFFSHAANKWNRKTLQKSGVEGKAEATGRQQDEAG